MNYILAAKNILYGKNLESKLKLDDHEYQYLEDTVLPQRSSKISISDEQIKFPKGGQLQDDRKKALALHFFANHELLAIELFAWSIISFPLEEKQIKTIILTIEEEQKHLSLYLQRMKDFGVELGDYPLNGFLWKTMTKASSFDEFYAMMALTFEQANLDFMKHYMDMFKNFGDDKTCAIFQVVYDDEIKHVARGVSFLNKSKGMTDLWEYYCGLLPEKITPSRAKGIIFDDRGRSAAGLDQYFIESLRNYSDQFKVTNRKEWKKDIT